MTKCKEDSGQKIKPHTGLTCLVVVAKSLGIMLDEKKLQDELNRESIDTAALSDIAKRFDLKSKNVKIKPEDLGGQETPAIALMKTGDFIVIGRIHEQRVAIFDPLRGSSAIVPLEEFFFGWSGELTLIKRKFSLRGVGSYFNLAWFIPVIKRYKRTLGEVFAASFFLQIFGLVTPLFTQVIIDKVLVHRGVATLDVLAMALLVFALFQLGIDFLRTYLLTHTTNKIDMILGAKLFRHLAALPLRYFEMRRVGDTLMRVSALNGIREFLTGSAMTVVMDTLFSVVFVAVMFYYSAFLTLISLAVVPLLIVQNIFLTPVYRERLNAMWAAGAESNAFLVESVTGIHTIKSLSLEPQFNHRWEQLVARYIRTAFHSGTLNIFISNSNGLIQRLSTLSILWFGGHMVMEGKMTVGQLIAFQMLAGQANAPLLRLVGMWQSFQQTALSVERLGDVLNTSPEPRGADQSMRVSLHGAMNFKDVVFRYSPELPPVLNQVSFSIKPGSRVGIVGRSGSGKSTLSKLMQRLYLPEAGQITIDGRDIAEVDPFWLRRQIGVVLQENYLFTGSVRDNITIARPSASMAEVIQAAQMAGAHEFVLTLPEGYDTQVGERGTNLSGGQRQRIAIARALLNNPRIAIFDEATSALDYESERIIITNMDRIAAGRTTLTIAHRLSTVRHCDLILVIEQGKVIEQGTHEELMNCRGLYYNLYTLQ